jgi:hypothetical protein
VVDEAMMRRTVLGTAMGNAVEWYDFGGCSYLAVVLGRVRRSPPTISATDSGAGRSEPG